MAVTTQDEEYEFGGHRSKYCNYIVWQQLPEGSTTEQVHELWLYRQDNSLFSRAIIQSQRSVLLTNVQEQALFSVDASGVVIMGIYMAKLLFIIYKI